MKSFLSKKLRNFTIVIFICIEVFGVGFNFYKYKTKEYDLINLAQQYKISDHDLQKLISKNTKDTILYLFAFSIFVLLAGIYGNRKYQNSLKQIQSDFENFTKELAAALKNKKPIQLKDELDYFEFDQLKTILNNTIEEIDQTENYNSLTKFAKKEKFLDEITELKQESEYHIIVCYVYFKGYENILVNKGFSKADNVVIEISKKITELQKNVTQAKVGKISGNGDFLFAFPCTVTPSYCIGLVSTHLHNIFSEILGSNTSNEQIIGLGYDILNDNNDKKDHDETINNAYRAALLASAQNNLPYFTYSEDLREQIQYGVQLENDLIIAIDKDELQVFYQAKIGAKDDLLKGAEALVRWKRNNKFENTEIFIKIAEKTDMIINLEKQVIRKVFKTQRMLQDQNIFMPISINISAKHLSNKNFLQNLLNNCNEFNIQAKYIEIEIIERQKLDDTSISTLKLLKSHGFGISIDDFGKDYSSLSYMNNLPIDAIKIDKSFIDGLDSTSKSYNENSKNLIDGMIKIAKSMKKTVIAEGVETFEQVEILRSLDCDELQGYYYHKGASPIEEFLNIYKERIILNQNTI